MKITLGKKIALGFGLGIAALILINFLAYSGTGKLLKIAKEVMQSRELDRILTQSEVDHLIWGRKVVNTIASPEDKTLEVQFDPHQCNFGKWFYGESRKEAERSRIRRETVCKRVRAQAFQRHQCIAGHRNTAGLDSLLNTCW